MYVELYIKKIKSLSEIHVLNCCEHNLMKRVIHTGEVMKFSFFISRYVFDCHSKKQFIGNFLSILILLFCTLILSPDAYSAAGDSISTTATIDFEIGGSPETAVATVVFTEDRKINFVVTDFNGGATVPVVSGMNDAVLQFTVTNLGNAKQDFLLTALNTSPNPFGLPADTFDPLSLQVFVESGLMPGYQSGQDTAFFIDELNPTASQIVYVVADLPSIVDDDVSAIALVAQVAEGGSPAIEGAAINADDNGRISPAGIFSNGATSMPAGSPNSIIDSSATMQTVFNDLAGLNPEDISTLLPVAQDILGNGQHSDTGAYQAGSPVLMTKTVTVIDTLGGSEPHPGAMLRYQIDVLVTGNTSVENLVITDLIPANTTYADGSIQLNGIAQTDADDSLTVDFSRANNFPSKPIVSIEVDLSKNNSVAIAPGTTNTIIFKVTIN